MIFWMQHLINIEITLSFENIHWHKGKGSSTVIFQTDCMVIFLIIKLVLSTVLTMIYMCIKYSEQSF